MQKVPLVSLTATGISPLVVKKGARAQSFKPHDQVVAFSQRVTDAVALKDSEIVFAGYGVQAPEYQWDDFKGLDVKGKTLIVLVNDPPVPDPADPDALDPKTFGGKAMTYYGRWTYKYEKAAELGAAGVFIVHETAPAGYPFNVVQGFGGERFDLVTPDKNMGRAAIQGWLSLEAATALLKSAGQDYQALKAQARTREFTPVPLGVTASMSFTQKMRTLDSHNVVAKITGADPALKNEYVVYTAHWDHLGVSTPVNGDAHLQRRARQRDRHGDAAGVRAGVQESAAAAEAHDPLPLGDRRRAGPARLGVLREVPAVSARQDPGQHQRRRHERLGAHEGRHDRRPGQLRPRHYARDAAAEQAPRAAARTPSRKRASTTARITSTSPRPACRRSTRTPGVEFVGKPADYGQAKRDEYTTQDYHQPSDEVKDWWDLSGAAEDGTLLFAVGYRVANADRYPEWTPGTEFRAVRDRMLKR